eukprot:bmy_20925T0
MNSRPDAINVTKLHPYRLSHTHLEKITASSSIAHIGCITAIIMYIPIITILNILIYIITTLSSYYLCPDHVLQEYHYHTHEIKHLPSQSLSSPL